MAARKLTPELLRSALETYCKDTGKQFSAGEEEGKPRYLLSPGDIIVREESGALVCTDAPTWEKISEIIMEQVEAPKLPVKAPGRMPDIDRKAGVLTAQDIINYINPQATEQEAYLFAEFCKRKGADPMTKQVYLVIFGEGKDRKASFIAGKEYFTEKAEAHPQFAGFRAGIIVRARDTQAAELERRMGTFYISKEEELLGGWAEVERKDREGKFVIEVPLVDYNTGKNQWAKMPATMIRKVALVQALREAFPANFGGMYDRSEMDQAIDPAKEVAV